MNAVENCIHLVATKCFSTKNFLRLFHILMQPFVMIEGSDFCAQGKNEEHCANVCKCERRNERWRKSERKKRRANANENRNTRKS